MQSQIQIRSIPRLTQANKRAIAKTRETALSAEQVFKYNPYGVPEDFPSFAAICQIRSGPKIVPFKLYDWQQELDAIASQYRKIVLFKVRQLGCTEFFACKMLHQACLSPAYSGLVLSMGGKETSKVAKRVRRMPSLVPGFRFATNAVTELQVKNGGTLTFSVSTNNAGRSLESVHDILCDEAAFVKNMDEIYASATPTQEMMGDAARTWVISTMSELGELSWFWKDMLAADNNCDAREIIEKVKERTLPPFYWWVDENGCAKVIVHWRAHPIYSLNPNYLEDTKKKKKIPEAKLQREYNLGIPQGGGSLFQEAFIKLGAIGQWKAPFMSTTSRSRAKYLAGIDPNFGGDDYYVCQIWDITSKPYSLVAQYRENNHLNEYNEKKALELIDAYKPVIVAVERSSGGAIALENLIKKRPRIRFEPVLPNETTKRINTDRLALALEYKEVIYPKDWDGVDEMRKFSLLTRKATSGHDDCIAAWAAAWVWLEEATKEANRLESVKSLLRG